jgi:prepilin-type N-terminal cleavage/methylation domain-containing protein
MIIATVRRARHGFTLVEFIVALVLLGIVSVFVVSGVLSGRERVENTRVEIAMRQVELAEREHAMTTGRYTADPAELELSDGVTAVIGASRDDREVSIAVDENGDLWLAVADGESCLAWQVADPMSDAGTVTVPVAEGACDAMTIANSAG